MPFPLSLERLCGKWDKEPSFRRKPESGVPGENRGPVFEMVPDLQRDGVWTPVFTGVTTFARTSSLLFDLFFLMIV